MSDFLIMDSKNNQEKNNNYKNNRTGILQNINDFLASFKKIKIREKATLYRLLSTMTNAGMGVVRSVNILEEQEKNPILKKVLKDFSEDLASGKNLSECMEKYPKIFDDSECGMIRSGEKTGKLNVTLKDLAEQIEKVASISGKLKSAMIYPAFIILVVFGVIFIMMTVVVPKLLEIFGEKDELPQSTQLLIFISDIFSNYWYFMIFGILFIYIAITIWKKTPDGHYNFDSIMLKIPIFGEVTNKLVLSKFSRIFAGLISSGISIVEGLKIVSDAVGNEVYKQRILLLSEDVSGGIKINESLDGDKLFPNMMVQMIKVGEETAKLDETITKVADFYDEQVDNTISTINKLLEPIIIIFLAVIVGLIAMGIIEPIMGIADTIK